MNPIRHSICHRLEAHGGRQCCKAPAVLNNREARAHFHILTWFSKHPEPYRRAVGFKWTELSSPVEKNGRIALDIVNSGPGNRGTVT